MRHSIYREARPTSAATTATARAAAGALKRFERATMRLVMRS